MYLNAIVKCCDGVLKIEYLFFNTPTVTTFDNDNNRNYWANE